MVYKQYWDITKWSLKRGGLLMEDSLQRSNTLGNNQVVFKEMNRDIHLFVH